MPRRAVQGLAVALLGGSASMFLLQSGAHASGPISALPAVQQQAWWWQNAYEQANPPVAEAPPTNEPSGVPAGDLAVAYTGNADKSSSKMTALAFDVTGLQPGASVEQFTFSLTLDTRSSATSFNASGATIAACLPTRLWPAELAGDYTNEPTVDCSKKVTPTVSGNTYTFKIPVIAQSWADDQNLGVAIVADPDKTAAPFQVVFRGAKGAHGTMVYLPAAPAVSGGGTTSGSTGAAASGAAAGAAAAPAAPAPGNVALPGATADATGSAPPPVVAAPAPATPATRNVASVKPASAAPTAGFWIVGVLLAAALLAASLVLGDPTPAPVAATRSRLDRVLRDREPDVLTVRSL